MADETQESITPNFFIKQIKHYEDSFSSWEQNAEKIERRYKNQGDRQGEGQYNTTRFNVFNSNVNIILSAMVSSEPQPSSQRKFKDNNFIGKTAAIVMERVLSNIMERENHFELTSQVGLDSLLGGRGGLWVYFNAQVDEAGNIVPFTEECVTDYVHYKDFGHSVLKTWKEVQGRGFIFRKVTFSKEQMRSKFGEELFAKLKKPSEDEDQSYSAATDDEEKPYKEGYDVYEVWDAVTKTRYHLTKSLTDEFLKVSENPYQLEGFFPAPKPVYSQLLNNSLIPIPDLWQYVSLLKQIDSLQERIDDLQKDLRLFGIYADGFEGLANLLTDAHNKKMIPVKVSSLTGEQKVENLVSFFPVEKVAQVLVGLYDSRDRIKQSADEIAGITDLQRGLLTDTNETLGQSRIRAQNSGRRIDRRILFLEYHIREIFRIKAQIVARLFSPITIRMLSGFDNLREIQAIQDKAKKNEIFEQVIQLFRSDFQNFIIDIETDSLRQRDETQKKQEVNEFISSLGGFLSQAVPLIQASPAAADIILETMMMGVRSHNVSRSIEQKFEEAVDRIKQEVAQQPTQTEELQQQVQQAGQQMGSQLQELTSAVQQGQGAIQQLAQLSQQNQQEIGLLKNGLSGLAQVAQQAGAV